MRPDFPKILYIGDVSVELTSAGSTLLYRLLEYYPKDKLFIIQSGDIKNDRTLAGVSYKRTVNTISEKLRRTRFYKIGSFIELLFSITSDNPTQKIIKQFEPEVIITVSFRFLWIRAFMLAKKNKIPFYFILHDDIISAEKHGYLLQKAIGLLFKKAYLFATERFCISQNMEKMYFNKYRVNGKILYPMMGKNDSPFDISSPKEKDILTFCYAGSMYTPDFPKMMDMLSGLLKEEGHKLVLFTEATREDLSPYFNMLGDHVTINKLVHPAVLREFMRSNVDVNILFNSFELEQPFKWNFSSKLVEYTLVGLPVLVWGPLTSGAISWLSENQYKAIADKYSETELRRIIKLFADTYTRNGIAKAFQELGLKTFSFDRNYEVFRSGISNGVNQKCIHHQLNY